MNTRSDRRVTFVLPGEYRSGGVRVTVIMANTLRARGWNARIVYPRVKVTLPMLARKAFRLLTARQFKNTGWIHEFRGEVVKYRRLEEVDFQPDDVVIAVGTYTVEEVRRMNRPVIKVRFNHGFPAQPAPAHKDSWKGSMPTITVSSTLVPKLEELSGEKVWAVIPNGIDRKDYHVVDGMARDGIGAIYNPHPNKSPADMIEVLRRAHVRWPNRPQYIFSTEDVPKGLEHARFTRYPSVEKARELYNRSKVWLLTSRTEGLPGAVLEAMACGCVVVSSDNDGSLEIIRDGQNGLIVPQANLDGYLEQIDRVFGNSDLQRKLAAGAAATAEEFTWERAADKMCRFLEEIGRYAKEKDCRSVAGMAQTGSRR